MVGLGTMSFHQKLIDLFHLQAENWWQASPRRTHSFTSVYVLRGFGGGDIVLFGWGENIRSKGRIFQGFEEFLQCNLQRAQICNKKLILPIFMGSIGPIKISTEKEMWKNIWSGGWAWGND